MRVELDRRAIATLGEEHSVELAVRAGAETIASQARTHAPGRTSGWIAAHDENVGYDSSFGHWIEWGTVNSQAYSPLRRALAELGLQLRAAE